MHTEINSRSALATKQKTQQQLTFEAHTVRLGPSPQTTGARTGEAQHSTEGKALLAPRLAIGLVAGQGSCVRPMDVDQVCSGAAHDEVRLSATVHPTGRQLSGTVKTRQPSV